MRGLGFWTTILIIATVLAACAGKRGHSRRKGGTHARDINAKVNNDHERARLDLPNLNVEQSKAAYQAHCENKISLDLKASEKTAAYEQIVTGQTGQWQLVDVRAYSAGKNVAKQIAGQAHGPFAFNGTSSSLDQPNGVNCHTNNTPPPATGATAKGNIQKATPDSKNAINMEFKIPNEIRTSDGKILSYAQFILQAREGRAGAQIRLSAGGPSDMVLSDADKQKAAPTQNASLRTVRIIDAGGRLIVRLSVDPPQESDGTQYTNFAEAIYELKR